MRGWAGAHAGGWGGASLPNHPPHTPTHPPTTQVDLFCECPLWPDDGMCSLRDCSVCECEEHEVPEPWRKAELVDSCDSECACVGWGWGWGGY